MALWPIVSPGYSTKSWNKNTFNVFLVLHLALIQRLIYYRQYLRLCACHSHNHMCLYNLDPFNTMSTIPYDIVRRLTRTPALYWCYHCIPGEILSHFYLRQSSESPILTILEALKVNRFLGKTKYCQNPT